MQDTTVEADHAQPIVEEIRAKYEVAPFGDRRVARREAERLGGIHIGLAVAFEASGSTHGLGTVEPPDEDVAAIAAALPPTEWPMRRVTQKFVGIPHGTCDGAETCAETLSDSAVGIIFDRRVESGGRTMVVVNKTAHQDSSLPYVTKELSDREALDAAVCAGLLTERGYGVVKDLTIYEDNVTMEGVIPTALSDVPIR